jgi:hypothetical protein
MEISLPEERGSSKLVQFKLEEKTKFFNKGRFVYTVGMFDCPRPVFKEIKKRKKQLT